MDFGAIPCNMGGEVFCRCAPLRKKGMHIPFFLPTGATLMACGLRFDRKMGRPGPCPQVHPRHLASPSSLRASRRVAPAGSSPMFDARPASPTPRHTGRRAYRGIPIGSSATRLSASTTRATLDSSIRGGRHWPHVRSVPSLCSSSKLRHIRRSSSSLKDFSC